MTTRHLNTYLFQGEYWMSKTGEYPIQDMDTVYRRRALHWLTRNSAELYRLWTLEAYVDGEPAPDLDTLIGWIDARPSNWVKTLPLYESLAEGVPTELIK
jgi:hypothetical protein